MSRNILNKSNGDNQMPKLYGNSPTPDITRKFLVKLKNFVASQTKEAWERTIQVQQLDEDGDPEVNANGDPIMVNETSIESMLLIFPDGGKPGRYPVPIAVVEPTTIAGEVAFEREKKVIKWKAEMAKAEAQAKSIVADKISYSGILKLAISNEIQDTMRRGATGRYALDGDKPLEIINELISTDFSPKATVAANPLVKYEEANARFNSENFKQEFNETLDAWEKRFGAELLNLKNLAQSAGKSAELPNEESLAFRFFMRTNGLYSKVKEDTKTGSRVGGYPATVEAAMVILRPFEKKSSQPNRGNAVRGVYVAAAGRSGRGNGNGNWQFKCPAHKTNDHNYNDHRCKEIINGRSDSRQAEVEREVRNQKGGRGKGRGRN